MTLNSLCITLISNGLTNLDESDQPMNVALTLTDHNAVSEPSEHTTLLHQHDASSLEEWILHAMSLDTEPSLPEEITDAVTGLAESILRAGPTLPFTTYLDITLKFTPIA